jgi:hypothetical protein
MNIIRVLCLTVLLLIMLYMRMQPNHVINIVTGVIFGLISVLIVTRLEFGGYSILVVKEQGSRTTLSEPKLQFNGGVEIGLLLAILFLF